MAAVTFVNVASTASIHIFDEEAGFLFSVIFQGKL
jgi:hypothetical protein